ncbi:leucine-rich repeat protein 1-like [Neltuma alba]|uniref:leucine-rich repeat protein 1-like n=1 Tax=Neltuma alba TaxID=207710 RepID=UPI0010A57C39|nr:leucine-rich repeat protein 1-like [Prosopis alba]
MEAAPTFLSFWVLLCFSLLLAVNNLVSANSEGGALYTLRRSLYDPNNVLQSWGSDPCQSLYLVPCHLQPGQPGVTEFRLFMFKRETCLIICNSAISIHYGVAALFLSLPFGVWGWGKRTAQLDSDLGNSNLSGHLVPELGNLEHLQYLELYKNNIQGTTPPGLGNLKNLISLDLYNNNISGTIPPSLGKLKNLVFMRLNDNRLTGPIPRRLADVKSLKVFDVSNNDLCGPIPMAGPFEHISLNNFENNPRLEGPELLGLASYETNCS